MSLYIELTPDHINIYKKLSAIFKKEDDYFVNLHNKNYGKKSNSRYVSSNVLIDTGYCVSGLNITHSDIVNVAPILCPGAHPGVIGFGRPY